jgi:4-amino-4-deoxy-L-arabinose transferase-like glycosyltransferase
MNVARPLQSLAPGAAGAPAPALRAGVVLWALGVGALFLVRLGAAPLFDVDEGAFAEATRELLESGDLGVTTLNGAPRFDKPILVYWLQAVSVSLLGLGEAPLRLPSALCAWAWCLAVTRFAWTRLGPAIALLAGTVLATSAGVLAIGRASTADALLNLLLALALLDAWRHLETGRRAPLLRTFLWIGLGLLAKGPVALVVPAAVTLLYCATTRELRRWARAAFDARGWAILLGVAAPWYAYALHRHGTAFVEGFIIRHNLARYTTPLEGHGGSLGYYVLALPLMLLPWSPLLGSVIGSARALWREPLARYLLLWAVFVLVFFSFSGTKLPHYALYGATPLFLLVARRAGSAGRVARGLTLGVIAALLLLFAVLPWLSTAIAPRIPDPLVRELLSGARELAPASLVPAVIAAGLAWATACGAVRSFTARAAAGAAGVAAVLVAVVIPWAGDVMQGPVKRAAEVARLRPEPAVQWRLSVPSFSVYRARITPRAEPAPGQLAIVRLDRIPGGVAVEVLYQERGYALVRRSGP